MPDEKNIVQTNPSEIAVVTQTPGYNNFTEFAEKVLTAEEVFKSNCKLCNSKCRREAEDKYVKTINFSHVHRWLQDQGEQISFHAVRNHLTNHFRRPELETRLKEYAEDIGAWSKIRQDRQERHMEHIAILSRRMHMLEAMTDNNEPEAQRKTAETVAKIIEQIGKEEERIEDMKQEESPIRILFYRFEDIIKTKVENISSPEARVALLDILESIAKLVEEFETDD